MKTGLQSYDERQTDHFFTHSVYKHAHLHRHICCVAGKMRADHHFLQLLTRGVAATNTSRDKTVSTRSENAALVRH